jgi:hypothetical protein
MQREGEITFACEAGGLVRGLAFWDAFGFSNQGLIPSIWVGSAWACWSISTST